MLKTRSSSRLARISSGFRVAIVTGLSLWLAAFAASAAPPPADSGLTSTLLTRIRFLTAERMLNDGDIAGFTRARPALSGYALLPYLDATRFRLRINGASPQALQTAKRALADTPLASLTHRRWLRARAKRGEWRAFLAHDDGADHRDLRCHRAAAQLETAKTNAEKKRAAAFVESLWSQGRSQPSACNAAFAAWKKRGRPYAAVLARLQLAFEASNRGLVTALIPELTPADAVPASHWLKVDRTPKEVVELAAKPVAEVPNWVLEHGLSRWTRNDPQAGLAALAKLRSTHPTRKLNELNIRRDAGVALFARQRYVAASAQFARWTKLSETTPGSSRAARASTSVSSSSEPSKAMATAEELGARESRARMARLVNAMLLKQWSRAKKAAAMLPVDQVEERQYWRARALEAGLDGRASTGQVSEASAEAHQLWQTLSKERSYYGFLAADRLGLPYAFGDRPIALPVAVAARARGTTSHARALEFRALGRLADFRREWRYLRDHTGLSLDEAAAFAHTQGWFSEGVFALSKAKNFDALEIRFPVAFESEIRAAAKRHRLQPAWTLATIRQESAFLSDVRSHAGAIGLMQILPSTGRQLGIRAGVGRVSAGRLTDPGLNIALGTRFMRELFNQFEHPLMVMAGYNAGPHRVRRWRPRAGPMPADLWVESVPFSETRKYIKRISYYRVIYTELLGEPNTRMDAFFAPVLPAVKVSGDNQVGERG